MNSDVIKQFGLLIEKIHQFTILQLLLY